MCFFYDGVADFCVNVGMVQIDEKDILVVRGKYCQCSYSWNKFDPYGIGPDATSTLIIFNYCWLFWI